MWTMHIGQNWAREPLLVKYLFKELVTFIIFFNILDKNFERISVRIKQIVNYSHDFVLPKCSLLFQNLIIIA